MDGARLGGCPHYSWFGFPVDVPGDRSLLVEQRATSHAGILGLTGAVEMRWTRRGREASFRQSAGQTSFFPFGDGVEETYVSRSVAGVSQDEGLMRARRHARGRAAAHRASAASSSTAADAPSATRNPRKSNRLAGSYNSRAGERQYAAEPLQPPPR